MQITTENQLLLISMIFLEMSKINFINNNFTLSYILSHRALDLFLQYECYIGSNLTIKTHYRNSYMCIQYDTNNNYYDKKDVTINNSLKVLVRHANTFSPNNKYVKFIKDFFNENRNLTYLAHGIYSISNREAKIGLNFVNGFLKHRLGIGLFNYHISKISFQNELNILELFEDDKYHLETFFTEYNSL